MYEVIKLAAAVEYLDSMQTKDRAKALAGMLRLSVDGPLATRPLAAHLRGKIWELRISRATNEHRFLYFFDRTTIIITHGFQK